MVRVCIVGAGVAGCTAASALHHALGSSGALELVVLEASARVGGRVKHAGAGLRCGGELGATWVHGKRGNPIYPIVHAATNGSTLQQQSWQMPVAIYHGRRVDPQFVAHVLEDVEAIIDRAVSKGAGIQGVRSVGEFLDAEWKAQGQRDDHEGEHESSETSHVLKDCIYQRRKRLECSISACDSLNDLRLDQYREYDRLDDNHSRNSAPMETFLHGMLAPLLPETVRLETRVTQVQRCGAESQDGAPLLVKAWDARAGASVSYLADFCIFTASLGVMKAEGERIFEPPLPPKKLQAIRRLGFGTVDKVLIEFEHESDPVKGELPQSAFLLGTPASAEEGHAPDTDKYAWLFDYAPLVYMDRPASGFLRGEMWLSGTTAREMEAKDDEHVFRAVQAYLHALAPLAYPKVRSIARSRWFSDPNFGGSYSYNAIESDGSDFETLAEPLPCLPPHDVNRPCILFAGEATHRSFYSTMHGAFASGEREAKRLLGLLARTADVAN
ncbi:putative polyamine oxidase 5 [Porphyridium purpureum]|uniref:Putative polyamine oxidase 5 n=1 Tax=Porphyridium purpureum TaxID=35688 RepID=A0A5J4Z9B3_PORPP|nr:putative polyamine oxidase 5 [Porphyridium purpureum]|eukprot:POR5747..scf295_1